MNGVTLLDRGLYALFARNADRSRHDQDRLYYRGAALGVAFDQYMARVYAVSWLVFGCILFCSISTVAVVSDALTGLTSFWVPIAGSAIGLVGLASKRMVVWGSRYYLKWRRTLRRERIEQTLPGAVRYLRALAGGSDDQRTMFRRVTAQDSYGETGVAFRRVLNHATLTGSFESGLQTVARDTPSEDLLAPFLLKFGEHAGQGSDALSRYLRMESRMLSHRQARARQRSRDFLELIAELFVVLLVVPALLVIVLSVLSVLSPRLSQQLYTPLGAISLRSVLVYGSAAFVLWIGAGAAWLIGTIRPPGVSPTGYDRPDSVIATVASVPSNPASASVIAVPLSVIVGGVIVSSGVSLVNAALLGYATGGIVVGGVAVRRRRNDDAKDHELRDFVHAVGGHVRLGHPFGVAVQRVAHDVDLGALQSDVNALAFRLGLLTTADRETAVHTAALDRFVERVGTPLAAQTVGLVTGALEAGSDADAVFETLQTEIGRLYHEKRALKSTMAVYVVVGWTTALLIVAIMIAVNSYVLDSFTQLASVSGPTGGIGIVSGAVQPERDRFQFYVVTQSTMLACGWFAGVARGGWYEAVLHSSLLVGMTYAIFRGVGMI